MRGYSKHWKQYVQRPNGIAGEVFFCEGVVEWECNERECWRGNAKDNVGHAKEF